MRDVLNDGSERSIDSDSGGTGFPAGLLGIPRGTALPTTPTGAGRDREDGMLPDTTGMHRTLHEAISTTLLSNHRACFA